MPEMLLNQGRQSKVQFARCEAYWADANTLRNGALNGTESSSAM